MCDLYFTLRAGSPGVIGGERGPSSRSALLAWYTRGMQFRSTVLLMGLILTGIVLARTLPAPLGVTTIQQHTLFLFLGTIVVILWNRFPILVIVLISLSVGMVLRVMTLEQALRGYSSSVTWIILMAFIFARTFVKTGLGRRIALVLIRHLGSSSLRLGYCFALSDLALAPVTPSNTARAGGIIYPIARSLVLEFDSRPGESARRIGAYVLFTLYQSNIVTSAMFLTAMAANGLSAKLALNSAGVILDWGTWFLAASVPGVCSLVLAPWVIYVAYPPEIRKTPEAAGFARRELEALGPMSQDEKILAVIFVLLGLTWASSAWHGTSTVAAAFSSICLLLLGGVLEKSDIIGESSAWETFLWFGGFLSIAGAVSDSGLIRQIVPGLAAGLGVWNPMLVLIVLTALYMYLHYLFASMTAQIVALYAGFLTLAVAAGVPPLLSALVLAFFSNLYACLTHYGDGAGPIIFGSGYIELKDWWRTGFLISLLHLVVWLGIGSLWWKLIGVY